MGIYYDKRLDKNKFIYTRTKRQRKNYYLIFVLGLVLLVVLPILNKFSFFSTIFNSITILGGKWPLYVFALGGIIIIINAILGSVINFHLFVAKLKNKKYEIKSDQNKDTIIISQ